MTIQNDYAEKSTDFETIIQMAQFYYDNRLYSCASTEFMWAASCTSDKNLKYSCLIKAVESYSRDNISPYDLDHILNRAIEMLPKRPEAYWLRAKLFSDIDYEKCYHSASTGLGVSDFMNTPLAFSIGYKNKYSLYMQKAIFGWWMNYYDESLDILHTLREKFYDDLDESQQLDLSINLMNLYADTAIRYDSSKYKKMAVKFSALKDIQNNFAKNYQDLFVLTATNGKKSGRYIEIGTREPVHNNPTFLLEKEFGWTGFSFVFDEDIQQKYANQRKNSSKTVNPRDFKYSSYFYDVFDNKEFDFLYLDCYAAADSFDIIKKIPFDEYKFNVVVFSHKDFCSLDREIKEKTRNFLTEKGYLLAGSNISSNNRTSEEDWWILPKFEQNILDIVSFDNSIKNAEHFMFGTLEKTSQTIKTNDDTDNTKSYRFNSIKTIYKQKPRVWIVDDFYNNPDEIREFALSQEYHQGGIGRGYIGRRTYEQFLFPGLKEEFERIMGMKITQWEEHGMNGRFQTNWAGDPLVFHADSQTYAGMIYLTPKAPYSCGTTLLAHKKTRIRHVTEEGSDRCFVQGNLDGTVYEPVDVIGNVYNRLAIFDAQCLHTASNYFGYDAHTGRLWQMFFFDAEKI